MIEDLFFVLGFGLLSWLLWRLARAERGGVLVIIAAVLLLVASALTGAALAQAGVVVGSAAALLRWLHDPLVALSLGLFPAMHPLHGAQLLVLGGYVMARMLWLATVRILALLARLWRRLRRARVDAARPATVSSGGWGALRSAARVVILVAGAVLASLPLWLPSVPFWWPSLDILVWVGFWVLLVELAAMIERAAAPAGVGLQISGQDVSFSTEHQLEQLYRLYIGRHRDMLFLCRRREADKAKAPSSWTPIRPEAVGEMPDVSRGCAAKLLQARWVSQLSGELLQRLVLAADEVDAGRDLLLSESLCSHHLLLIAALVQDRIDMGRSVLILCPESGLDEIRAGLGLYVDRNLLQLSQRWLTLDRDESPQDGEADLIFCSDSVLERSLPMGDARTDGLLSRLGLIVCLEIQALNVPLARFVLSRVRTMAAISGRVPLVIQAAGYDRVEVLARSLHAQERMSERRIQAWLQTTRYMLVWDRDHQTLAEQRRHYFPKLQERIGPACLLLMPAWELGLAVSRLDPGNRHDEDAFERFLAYLPANGHDDKLPIASAHRPLGYGDVGAGAAVSLLDDPAHLLIALDHDGGSTGLKSSLINVLCGNYLLRDYLRALLAVHAPQDLPRRLRPLATRPRGNHYTLAYTLYRAMKSAGFLAAEEIRDQFLDPLTDEVFKAVPVRLSRAGLQKLFDFAFGKGALAVSVRRARDEVARYSLSTDRHPPREAYLAALNEQGDRVGWVYESDHGLIYAQDQTLLFGHKLHRVLNVNDSVRLQHAQSHADRIGERYFFRRHYRLPMPSEGEPKRVGAPVRHRFPDGLEITLSFELREVERETLGYWSLPESMRPFASSPAALSNVDLRPPIRQQYPFQSVAHLMIIDPAGQASRADHDADRIGRLVFTFCSLLQDAMESVFPDHYPRVAVLSPQARWSVESVTEPLGRAAGLDESLSTETSADGAAGTRAIQSSQPATGMPSEHAIREFLRTKYPVLEQPTEEEAGDARPDALRIDIYVVEDSRFDLGVARALSDRSGLEHLLSLVRDYLNWAESQPPERLYQAFGAGRLSDLLDYAGCLNLLNRLLRPVEGQLEVGDLDEGCTERGKTLAVGKAECDFCAGPLTATYERLDDGRCRCTPCSSQAVDTTAEFQSVYREVRESMERDYRIRLRRDLGVRFLDAAQIAEAADSAFVPTSAMDPRVVGLAIDHGDGTAEILLENGAPRLNTAATLVHELTHLWQFESVPDLGRVPLETVEGQARFVEVDYLRRHGGGALAESIVRESRRGSDVYSRGYRLVESSCGGERDRLFDCFRRQLSATGS